MVHYIYNFGDFCPLTEFYQVQTSLCVQVLRSPILAALLHGTPAAWSAKLCNMVQGMELRNFRRGRHLYSAERPSRWASAHILVRFVLTAFTRVLKSHRELNNNYKCGPVPNVVVALPNIVGAVCSTPQSLADAHY